VKHSDPLAHLQAALGELEAAGLLRTPPRPMARDGAPSFCTNDYLGLASEPAAVEVGGAGASRLIAGEHDQHAALEREVSEWLGLQSALLFSSGYAANLGALSALARPGDRIVSDALNHASIIDGARLSGAEVVVVAHTSTEAVAEVLARPCQGRTWVVTESYFSMDADGPDLARLRSLCDSSGAALFVDEAHALGVFGPDGRGLCAAVGVRPDVLVGTFGKSFGASAAFVAGSDTLRSWLWNRARSFVFSTGISPVVAATARANLARSQQDPSRRERVLANATRLRDGLSRLGIVAKGHGPIVPWVVGAPDEAMLLAKTIQARGHHVVAVRPPTVPVGTSRLRLAVTARHTPEQIDALLDAIREALACLPHSSS
jgi:8-amino-7-oxononanoate synthase